MSTDGLCFCEQRSQFLPEKPLGKFCRRWSLCSTCCHCCTHIPLDPLPFSCTVAPICFHSRQPAWVSEDHWCCFGCEDTFNFVSSARSESYKCLAIPPPPPMAALDWWRWMQQYEYISSLAPGLWGVVALSLQLPLQDWAKFTLCRTTSFPSLFLFLCLYWLF